MKYLRAIISGAMLTTPVLGVYAYKTHNQALLSEMLTIGLFGVIIIVACKD